MFIPSIVFLFSGVAALLYQVIWQRMLVMFSGADVYSSTIIVAAFMAGLGVGNLAGGHLADRVSRRTSLMLFACAELAIAGFGALSKTIYYDQLYHQLGPADLHPVMTGGILFASLLWPTFFMGVSLPLLARALTPDVDRAASVVGNLYGLNTLGAAVGAFAATWFILPRVGLETGLDIGAGINAACALLVLPLGLRLPAATNRTEETEDTEGNPGVSGPAPAGPKGPALHAVTSSDQRFIVWAAIYALSGFLALSLEIVWFRLVGVMMKGTAFTFGTLVSIYLTGLAVGALAGSAAARFVRRPSSTFLGLQAAVGLSAACLLALFVGIADDVQFLREYFGRYESLDVRESVARLQAFFAAPTTVSAPWDFITMYFLVPAVLILPPTLLMGFSFPVLQRVVQTDLTHLGRRVGLLLVANIVGSVAGTLLTGWVLLNVFGTAGTVRALATFSVVFVLLSVVMSRRQSGSTGIPGAVGWAIAGLLIALVALPDAPTLWARLHGALPEYLVFKEDATGLSAIRIERGANPLTTVFVNGLGQSTMPYGGIHTMLGMLPAFVHPRPQRIAIIGLGSGDTVYGAAGRQEVEALDSIEIIAPQVGTLRMLVERVPYGGVLGLLADRRIVHRDGDGRRFLMRAPQAFDVIEADALRPTSAYSGNLYSEEYFTLVRERLRPNGLAATWSPTARVHNAFIRVFPHVVSVPGILLGSRDPIRVDRHEIAARLADARVRSHYDRAGIDAQALMAEYLKAPAVYGPDFDRRSLTDFNTDLFPKDEFELRLPK